MATSVTSLSEYFSAPKPRSVSRQLGSYAHRLLFTDALVVIAAVFASQFFWLGDISRPLTVYRPFGDVELSYLVVSALIAALWLVMLELDGTRSHRVVGLGSSEFRFVTRSTFLTFGTVAVFSYLLQFDLSRGYLFIAFPAGLIGLLASRLLWRQWLRTRRGRGEYSARVLLVGSDAASIKIAADLSRQPEAGYRIVGACTPDGGTPFLGASDIPVFGDFDAVERAMLTTGADTVMVSSSDRLPAERVREIGWSLEAGRQHLVVAPSLTDIGGPRIHTRPVAGMPLIHVETPRYSGRAWVAKRAFDIIGSAALLFVLAPVFAVLALLVRASGPGPVFYLQERVGIRGTHFKMVKFRSMRQDADAQLMALLAAQGSADRPLFKVDHDPRVTPIGRILRKYSLDELPQLLNVFGGSMSLVGPRPQRDGEVALYDSASARRLIAKPGMSGLWQVSGRSSLSWEDSIRLDLYYVENWSLASDLGILFKTARAVVAPGGTAH